MAEFRRLISYIYEYEGNIKGKNVGFVKLEARNGMCRLNVNVKKLYMGSGDMGVYLLTGRQEIFLGNIFLRNGCGEFRAVVQVTDVQDSGETMDECYGLTIHGKEETWRVYTTIWEDAIAQTAQLMLEPVTSERAFEHEAETGRLSSVVPEPADDAKKRKRQEKKEISQDCQGKAAEEEGFAVKHFADTERGIGEDQAETKESDTLWEFENMQREAGVQETEDVQSAEAIQNAETIQNAERIQGMGSTQKSRRVQRTEAVWETGRNPDTEPKWEVGNVQDAESVQEDPLHKNKSYDPFGSEPETRAAQAQHTCLNHAKLPNFEMGLLELETQQPDIPLKRNDQAESAGYRRSGERFADPARPAGQPGKLSVNRTGFSETAVFSGSTPSAAREPSAISGLEFTASRPESTVPGQEAAAPKTGLTAPRPGSTAPKTGLTAPRPGSTAPRPEPATPKPEPVELRSKAAETQPVIHQYREEPLIIGDPEALAKLDEEDAKENQVPIWEFLSKTYPKIQAFDSEYGCQVLVIKPQDIGLLPREVWIYGNNSFLLHGYYNYRYLILARLENPKGTPRYLLGVPGHYYSNEKYMASMFGFPQFVLSKKQTTQNGRFGYWYTDIRLEDEASVPIRRNTEENRRLPTESRIPGEERDAAKAAAETAASSAKATAAFAPRATAAPVSQATFASQATTAPASQATTAPASQATTAPASQATTAPASQATTAPASRAAASASQTAASFASQRSDRAKKRLL